MNKKDRKSDSSASLYEREFQVLEEMEIAEKYKKLGKKELLAEFNDLLKNYKKFLKQSIKIIRVGDSSQRKLLQANEKIEMQKKELEASRKTLSDELSDAAAYIISLIPPPLTSGPVLTEWKFVPSAQLGGDSLGYHWIDEEHFAMYLLDVCNHGVRPALLSVSVIDVLRAQNLADSDFREPGDVLTNLNQVFQIFSPLCCDAFRSCFISLSSLPISPAIYLPSATRQAPVSVATSITVSHFCLTA